MKPYDQLTNPGKLRRLHQLAQTALEQYDLKEARLTFHRYNTNLLFRVDHSTGEKYILRVASPGWRTLEDLQLEACWLNALSAEPAIHSPRIIPARTCEFVIQMKLPGITNVRNCTLMSWVPGRLLGHYLTETNLEKMGALFALLHIHGASWRPPEGTNIRRFEHWLCRGEKNLIIDQRSSATIAGDPVSYGAISPQHRNLLEQINQMVEAAYAAIDISDMRIIHCDLWHDNIKLHKGVLYPFDFEDTTLGFRSHDIAMAMLDLLETTGMERYPCLLSAFRNGYTSHLNWPDDPIEPFQIGRMLWVINAIANHDPSRLMKTIERHIPVFEHFMNTGNVILPEAD